MAGFALTTSSANAALTSQFGILDPTVNVRDNTGTADLTGGFGVGVAGVPVYTMDGRTAIARNNADIWNGWSNPFRNSAKFI